MKLIFFSWRDTRSSNGKKVSLNKKHVYNTSPDVFTFCPQKTGNWKFWDEQFFKMSLYICQNFQFLILYNFQFHHMVWKRFPTVLKSFSIFVRKGGKMTKIKLLERGFLRDVLLHIGENFQNDIRDIFQFFHMVKNSIFDFWYSKNKENQIFGSRSSLGWTRTYVRTFGMTFQTMFSFIIWVSDQ